MGEGNSVILRKFLIVVLCLSSMVRSQDFKSIKGLKMENGSICYSQSEQQSLDKALEVGVNCQLKLIQIKKQDVPRGTNNSHKKLIFLIGAAFVAGVGLGIGVSQ